MIWKIIVAIVAVLIIAFIVLAIVSRIVAKKNLKAFLACLVIAVRTSLVLSPMII